MDANGFGNITIIECAIGRYDGIGLLYLSENSSRHSLVASSAYEQVSSIPVSVKRLDSLISELGTRSVDLVRMDIEGYEVEAVDGMQNVLRAHKPILVMEVHPFLVGASKIEGLLRQLGPLGYDAKYLIDGDLDVP